MELVQARIVTDEVHRAAAFYASLLEVRVALNEYYVEVPAGAVSIGFSKSRFTECESGHAGSARPPVAPPSPVILDLEVTNVDEQFRRIDALGVDWVLHPTTQPWGNRSMVLRDPSGVLINIFSRPSAQADSGQGGRQ